MITKTQLIKEIIKELWTCSPPQLIKIFDMIFGSGEESIDSVNWKK
tara:strand:+ start:53 stop:190 length:138 start_codon:yes stop_codon:yes gene_type:complete